MAEISLPSRRGVLGVQVSSTTLDESIRVVLAAAAAKQALGVTALASHGVMTGVKDLEQMARLNELDLVTPDGQPVRWALNLLHSCGLRERVYGPDLMRGVCQHLAERGGRLALYGSTCQTLDVLADELIKSFPGLKIVFSRPSKFRAGTAEEFQNLLDDLQDSKPDVCFVGLGCPRQEVFVFEAKAHLDFPIVAVGAAFDFLAGISSEPAQLTQKLGLQWLHRFLRSPRRLFHRYMVLGPTYVFLVIRQRLTGRCPDSGVNVNPQPRRYM